MKTAKDECARNENERPRNIYNLDRNDGHYGFFFLDNYIFSIINYKRSILLPC